jgi:branched-chain amino acid transport system substrate-binding protein
MRKKALATVAAVLFLGGLLLSFQPCAAAEKATAKKLVPDVKVDFASMSDMSDFDPGNPVIPTGDTIKVAVITAFSGPASMSGDILFFFAQWVAHDVNKKGGILIDGKKKLIQVIKADNMGTVDGTNKVAERMAVQEKVHMFFGSATTAMAKVMGQVANKHKVISVNINSADDAHDAENFTRYSFMTGLTAAQDGRAYGYYYGQIRKKERKFYILTQDTMGGHSWAEGFKEGLTEFYPTAQIVGEDYHKMMLTDFAPYITKVKASGAEVIFAPTTVPDILYLIKQTRQMGLEIPLATLLLWDPSSLKSVGIEGSKGVVALTHGHAGNPYFKNPEAIKWYKNWHELWKNKWKGVYAGPLFENPFPPLWIYADQFYWAISAFQRAGSTDPEKVIKAWEGEVIQFATGEIAKMRACDHKAIHQMEISEFVPPEQQKVSFNIPPYSWGTDYSYFGPVWPIPVEKTLPWMDQKLDRCKGKNDWGE